MPNPQAPHVTELAGALNGAGHEVHIFTRSQAPVRVSVGVVYSLLQYGIYGGSLNPEPETLKTKERPRRCDAIS